MSLVCNHLTLHHLNRLSSLLTYLLARHPVSPPFSHQGDPHLSQRDNHLRNPPEGLPNNLLSSRRESPAHSPNQIRLHSRRLALPSNPLPIPPLPPPYNPPGSRQISHRINHLLIPQ